LLVFDASELENIFSESMINKIYLNFSDPWPKKRHEKNRLTNWKFLYIYQKILLPNKTIEFKTDNDLLYLYTLNDVILNSIDKINLIYNTENLYENIENKYNFDNVQTEYEKKFLNINKNINKIIYNFK
jgi:tRNA (guanine-N7-)-methyltransferase